MTIKELTTNRGFRGFRYDGDDTKEYVFAIRKGSFDCFNNYRFLGNLICIKVVDGRIYDFRFDNFSGDGDFSEAISRNVEKKLKRLIYREIF